MALKGRCGNRRRAHGCGDKPHSSPVFRLRVKRELGETFEVAHKQRYDGLLLGAVPVEKEVPMYENPKEKQRVGDVGGRPDSKGRQRVVGTRGARPYVKRRGC